MVLVGKKRPAHVALVKEFNRRMAVIDGEHVASFKAAADLTDPVARFQPRFGVLPFAKSNALRRKIFGYGASRERGQHIYETSAVEHDENFVQRAAIQQRSSQRHRI